MSDLCLNYFVKIVLDVKIQKDINKKTKHSFKTFNGYPFEFGSIFTK